jgi:hypothetical protein
LSRQYLLAKERQNYQPCHFSREPQGEAIREFVWGNPGDPAAKRLGPVWQRLVKDCRTARGDAMIQPAKPNRKLLAYE